MPEEGSQMKEQQEQQELTVLIYFASDNPLAPLVVSELKAIKDAGFQEDTTVLCLYDPMEKSAPTQLLDVNFKRRKAIGTLIGDGADPYVRNMTEDEVPCKELTPAMQVIVDDPSATVTAFESLRSFIEFGLQKRPARNYMLILLGHGMIVANDTFLPDGDTNSAITLKQLKVLCEMFTRDNKTLRLLGLHSCSMSSIEVAYELKGKADYMLATQGTMFVNGWPYRQLLKKTFNQVKHATKPEGNGRPERNGTPECNAPVDYYHELIGKLYYLCLYNFTDFLTAGYSCDIALCRLHPENFERLKKPLQDLVAAMKQELAPPVSIIKNLILLAHWDAQSFWSENYTDLWDFCACLAKRCIDAKTDLETMEKNGATGEPIKVIEKELGTISELCEAVKKALAFDTLKGDSKGIVRNADNFGIEYQYARGLSIYFPWHQPFEVQETPFDQEQCEQTQNQPTRKPILQNYRCYDFTREFGDHSWFSFLQAYWDGTKRAERNKEELPFYNRIKDDLDLPHTTEAEDVYKKAKDVFDERIKRTPELKKTPDVGTDCACPTIKNYPTSPSRPKSDRPKSDRNVPQFSITPGALGAFLPPKEGENVEQ